MKGKLIKAYSISENEILAKDTEIEITNIYIQDIILISIRVWLEIEK